MKKNSNPLVAAPPSGVLVKLSSFRDVKATHILPRRGATAAHLGDNDRMTQQSLFRINHNTENTSNPI